MSIPPTLVYGIYDTLLFSARRISNTRVPRCLLQAGTTEWIEMAFRTEGTIGLYTVLECLQNKDTSLHGVLSQNCERCGFIWLSFRPLQAL